MPFPTIASSATSVTSSASTTHVVSLPSGIVAGDLLLVNIYSLVGNISGVPSGWRLSIDPDQGSWGIAWKIADGSEGSTATFTMTASAVSAHSALRISGGAPPQMRMATGLGANANPPSLTHVRGTFDCLWVAIANVRRNATGCDVTAAPSGYSGLTESAEVTDGAGSFGMTAFAYRQATVATEDPGAFSDTGNTTGSQAITLCVPYAPSSAITSITKQADATSTASTITCPTVERGDLLVLADSPTNSSGTPTTVVPTGFTSIENISLSTRRQIVSYKIADGSESGSSITGMNGTSANRKVLVVYRPNRPATTAYVFTVAGQATTANPFAVMLDNAAQAYPQVVIGIYGATGAVDPRTFTVDGSAAKDGEVAVGTSLYQAWKIYNSGASTVSIDMDDEGSNYLQACWIELFSPASFVANPMQHIQHLLVR